MREAVPAGVRLVGVFVDERPQRIDELIESIGLDRVQLHGKEPRALVERYGERAIRGVRDGDLSVVPPGVPVIYDRPWGETRDVEALYAHWRAASALVDDWNLLLAGRLDPGNVAQAVREVRPYGVDCASGVESSAGIKDHEKRAATGRSGQGGGMSTAQRGLDVQHAPDALGRFGRFGGRFVPETVMAALDELEAALAAALVDPAFATELAALGRDYVGRQTPLYLAERLTAEVGGARIWLKREDLAHTGAHKINNAVGPGAARAAARQAAHRGRDRRGSARRRERDRVRALRPGVHRLHGRGGHAAPGAQRHAHAPARRHRRARHVRHGARSRRP